MRRLLFLAIVLLPTVGAAQEPLIPRYREAELGDAEAQVEVGHYYAVQYAKNRIGRNLVEARDWYGRAARQRDATGMMRLAELHLRPEPEVHDPAAAFEWYDRLYRDNRPGTGCHAALARFYAAGVPSADGKAKSPPHPRKAYYHCLLQLSTGNSPHDIGQLTRELRGRLTDAEVRDAEEQAFRWVEERNKPVLKPEVAAIGKGGARSGKGDKEDKEGKATTTDEPVDTADKALALAIKNQQESARQVAPLGKQKRYALPSTDREKK